MSGLLATKLHRPSIPQNRVARPFLLQRLNEGLESDRQVTLVSAPAGFGKTACLSEWAAGLDMPVAWLSLDDSDDDPGRFFSYLIAALQGVDGSLGREIEGVLRAGELPPGEIISTTLINDIQGLQTRFLLVLDDFQVIQDRSILEVLGALLEELPRPLHLALLTREDPSLPLARLRAHNQLTEIRAADLRFSPAEAASFLNEGMGLALSEADVAALDERTEGWIVGLQLAGLSIRDRADPSGFIANLSGSHRFILGYLTEEVLAAQTEEVRTFLLQTSVLERLNGDLCNAVTGRTDSRLVLERLLAANLFIVPLDDEGQWYRYHHLFADLLRDIQGSRQAQEADELHRRASRWYAAQAGMASEAVQHALAARDYETAVQLIESHAMDMLMQWHVKTVQGWMRAIPPEWCAQSPSANLAFAWMHLHRGDFVQAAPYLERLQAMSAPTWVSAQGDPSLEAKWLALQAMLLNAQGQAAQGLDLTRRALSLAPKEDGRVRTLIQLAVAGACQQLDDYEGAAQAFQEIIRRGRAAGNSVYELLGISGLALMAIQRGELHFAFELASQGIERVERSGSLPPVSTAVYGELGTIHYQWHQLEQAHHHFQRAIQVSALSGYSDAELFYGVILSRLFQIQGDLEAAAREIQKAVDLMRVEAPAVVLEEVVSQQVRIQLAMGDLAAAEGTLRGHGGPFKDGISLADIEAQTINRPNAVLYVSALRILLCRSKAYGEPADFKTGIRLADQLIDGALQHQYIPFALEVLLVRAQLHAAFGDERASQADYVRALELGEPEGYVSLFVEEGPPVAAALKSLLEQDRHGIVRPDYLRQILGAFPGSGVTAQAAVAGLLTERELEVLHLMAEGMKYEEIARKMYVSLNTVRSHVKAAYGKLGVNNRTKAIELAREMHLL